MLRLTGEKTAMNSWFLRARYVSSIAGLIVANASGVDAEQFPFPVYAAESGVVVRGGPGEAYYSTQELKRGDELVVYRIDDKDWFAVRPPQGSFSLVSANAVADQGNGKGEIVRHGAASRVGSSIHPMQDTVHVRLEKGEWINILGSQMRDGLKWLRIEPPHGEFRWVHRGDVTMTPPGEKPPMNPDPAVSAKVLPLGHNGDRYSAPPLGGADDPAWTARDDAAKPLPQVGAALPPAGSNGSVSVTPRTEDTGGASGTRTEPVAAPATGDEAFDRQMFVLEVVLGQIVAYPPEKWNLGGLEQDAANLLASAKTEQQREAVRQFAARLNRFSAIRRQHELLPSVDTLLAARSPVVGSPPPTTTAPLANTIARSVSDATGASGDDARFDAMGLLRPVASKRPDAPKYALVNDTGQIITFVTPAPDVNLQPYLGRRIGVSGQRGYMAEFNHRHVTAGRVQPVGDRVLR